MSIQEYESNVEIAKALKETLSKDPDTYDMEDLYVLNLAYEAGVYENLDAYFDDHGELIDSADIIKDPTFFTADSVIVEGFDEHNVTLDRGLHTADDFDKSLKSTLSDNAEEWVPIFNIAEMQGHNTNDNFILQKIYYSEPEAGHEVEAQFSETQDHVYLKYSFAPDNSIFAGQLDLTYRVEANGDVYAWNAAYSEKDEDSNIVTTPVFLRDADHLRSENESYFLDVALNNFGFEYEAQTTSGNDYVIEHATFNFEVPAIDDMSSIQDFLI